MRTREDAGTILRGHGGGPPDWTFPLAGIVDAVDLVDMVDVVFDLSTAFLIFRKRIPVTVVREGSGFCPEAEDRLRALKRPFLG